MQGGKGGTSLCLYAELEGGQPFDCGVRMRGGTYCVNAGFLSSVAFDGVATSMLDGMASLWRDCKCRTQGDPVDEVEQIEGRRCRRQSL